MSTRETMAVDEDGRQRAKTGSDSTGGVAGVPLIIAAGEDFTVPENVQMVYVLDLVIDGTLTLDGVLAKVA